MDYLFTTASPKSIKEQFLSFVSLDLFMLSTRLHVSICNSLLFLNKPILLEKYLAICLRSTLRISSQEGSHQKWKRVRHEPSSQKHQICLYEVWCWELSIDQRQRNKSHTFNHSTGTLQDTDSLVPYIILLQGDTIAQRSSMFACLFVCLFTAMPQRTACIGNLIF